MADIVFTTDQDLVDRRPKILELGVDSFQKEHIEAARIIIRDLKRWHQINAEMRGIQASSVFDLDLFLEKDIEIRPAATLLALSLAYQLLSKDTAAENDGFQAKSGQFKESFDEEWGKQLEFGFSYDWDESGDITLYDSGEYEPRTLARG